MENTKDSMPSAKFLELPLDESMIGPLSSSSITAEPVAWGIDATQTVVCADPETQAWLDAWAEHYTQDAKQVFREEVDALCTAVQEGTEPATVLHGMLRYGKSAVPKIAGYIGRPVGEVEPRIQALNFLGVLVPARERDSFGNPQYEVDFNAQAFADIAQL